MAEPTSLDPFALVRDLVSQLEKGVNEFANPLMKSEGFAKGANRAMSAAMTAKKLAQELSQRYFEALNIPSRRDILALIDRMQVLEDHMINMQSTLDRLAGGANRSALPAPARTRKPPAPVVEVAATPARAPALKRGSRSRS
jgi:hypothetical protein